MWSLLLLIIVTIAAFAVPKFGKALLVTVIVLVVVGAVALYVVDRQYRAERELARTRIQRSELDLIEVGLRPSFADGSYTLVGRVRNRSRHYTLTRLTLRLRMRDCIAAEDCDVVGETSEMILTNIPPGQVREFKEYVYFSNLGQPRGRHQWDYEMLELLGER